MSFPMNELPNREAIIDVPDSKDVDRFLETVQGYLPASYNAKKITVCPKAVARGDIRNNYRILIFGRDDHGWTLDGYVIPRLGSGLIAAREITADDEESPEDA